MAQLADLVSGSLTELLDQLAEARKLLTTGSPSKDVIAALDRASAAADALRALTDVAPAPEPEHVDDGA